MYELIILSLLMRWPAHGYLIAKIINDMIGPYARISNGRLYPLLAKLEEQGLIEAYVETGKVSKGDRQHRGYKITEEGRERFHELMMDTNSNPGEYQRIFLQKASVLEFLKPAERIYLIDHYINYCQAHVLHLKTEEEDLVRNQAGKAYMTGSHLEASLDSVRHLADQWRLEVEWAISLREKELARIEAQKLDIPGIGK